MSTKYRYREEWAKRKGDGKFVLWRWMRDMDLGFISRNAGKHLPHIRNLGRWVAIDVRGKPPRKTKMSASNNVSPKKNVNS